MTNRGKEEEKKKKNKMKNKMKTRPDLLFTCLLSLVIMCPAVLAGIPGKFSLSK